jgi:hypothetical protein
MLSDRWHLEQRTTSKPALCGLEILDEVDVLDDRLSSDGFCLIAIGLVRRPPACVCSCIRDGLDGEAIAVGRIESTDVTGHFCTS